MFIRFDVIHERDRRTDGRTNGHTLHDSKDRACIASRGNYSYRKRTVRQGETVSSRPKLVPLTVDGCVCFHTAYNVPLIDCTSY